LRFRVGYTHAMDDSGLAGGFDWENVEDVTALSEEELRGTLEALSEEERALSYRHSLLQGRIDLIRAELVERGAVALPPEQLARVLLGDTPVEETR
jgi:UDP-N-acetylenolpyruvoylglucosamine reductase